MNFYALTIGKVTPWAHLNGQFYAEATAPAGSYPLTDSQYQAVISHLAMGDTLGWYDNQRPYCFVSWTRPNYTSDFAADGTRFTANSYYNESLPHKAMDGVWNNTNDRYIWQSHTTTGWWCVVFPFKISILDLVHINRENSSYSNITGQYFADSSMTIPLGDKFNAVGSLEQVKVFSTTTPVVTNTIYFQKIEGHYGSGIGELQVTANRISYEVPQ
jgi:hypothetical protein